MKSVSLLMLPPFLAPLLKRSFLCQDLIRKITLIIFRVPDKSSLCLTELTLFHNYVNPANDLGGAVIKYQPHQFVMKTRHISQHFLPDDAKRKANFEACSRQLYLAIFQILKQFGNGFMWNMQ